MLNSVERELILSLVEERFTAGGIIQSVRRTLGPEGEFIYLNLSATGTPSALAEIVLAQCIQSAYDYDPPLLRRLIADFATYQGIKPILDRLDTPRSVPDPAVAPGPLVAPALPMPAGGNGFAPSRNPLDSRILVDRRVFLARDQVRRMVQSLRDRNGGYYVGLVNGETRSGQTYTTYYAMHVSRSFSDFLVASVKVPRQVRVDYKDTHLATALVQKMGRKPRFPKGLALTEEKRGDDIAAWVLAEAAATRKNWWFIIDGLDDPRRIDASAFRFVEQMIHQIGTNTAANHVRLLLLSYGETIPPSLKPNVFVEAPPLIRATIRESALKECFLQLFASKGATGQQLDATAEAAVKEVMKTVTNRLTGPPQKPEEHWLECVCDAAQEVVDAVG